MTDAVVQLLGQIPPAIYVLALLAGPTLAWLAYRSVASRRSLRSTTGELHGVPVEPEYWQCPDCLSLTPLTRASCYSCGFQPGVDDVEDLDEAPDRAPAPSGFTDVREAALPRR